MNKEQNQTQRNVVNVAVINCHDSFVYNLVEILRHTEGCRHSVYEYTEVKDPQERQSLLHQWISRYDAFLLSPGPGIPEEMPLLKELIHKAEGHCSILGVCLGMQAIAHAYGARLKQLECPVHGRSDYLVDIAYGDRYLLDTIDSQHAIGRYHSWAIDESTLPPHILIQARSRHDHLPMAIRHLHYPFWGVQYHPESYLSEEGERLIGSWIEHAQKCKGAYPW